MTNSLGLKQGAVLAPFRCNKRLASVIRLGKQQFDRTNRQIIFRVVKFYTAGFFDKIRQNESLQREMTLAAAPSPTLT
jgi:hypothetical protein